MEEKNFITQITEVAEELGWCVSTSEGQDGKTDFELEIFTNTAGHDFIVNISASSLRGFWIRLGEFAESFDPEEEAVKWIGADGHGTNGAPYSIRTLLADMDECKEHLERLEQEICKRYY